MSRTLLLVISTFISGLLPAAGFIQAQTIRVNAGTSAEGCPCYKEVYEYDFVELKPIFPGGDNKMVAFINESRKYPAEAYRKGIEGRVICSFVINTSGNVTHPVVLKGVEPSLNDEAIRIISAMPCWKPGRQYGHPVPVRVVVTVPFRR